MAVTRKTYMGERNAEVAKELNSEERSHEGGAKNLMDYEEEEQKDETKATTLSTHPNMQSA